MELERNRKPALLLLSSKTVLRRARVESPGFFASRASPEARLRCPGRDPARRRACLAFGLPGLLRARQSLACAPAAGLPRLAAFLPGGGAQSLACAAFLPRLPTPARLLLRSCAGACPGSPAAAPARAPADPFLPARAGLPAYACAPACPGSCAPACLPGCSYACGWARLPTPAQRLACGCLPEQEPEPRASPALPASLACGWAASPSFARLLLRSCAALLPRLRLGSTDPFLRCSCLRARSPGITTQWVRSCETTSHKVHGSLR